ncbi:DUF1684 domain-containing protein [Pedobacter yulinensis]|uniref:DUF1684 domain-containing protein n=1 Tax=Pedobacter yulinensis TaxID=2126353 RepID=A0A2T3HMP5_9SPHI|nr:DUF1684 domain-containing protein [Pedobacter yulinensis]PST83720.1 DUF1684 domain-containing protein [Pedobacter yulinensis]
MKRLLSFLLLLTCLQAGAQNFAALTEAHRDAYKKAFLTDDHAPLKEKDLESLRFFSPDSTCRVTAKVTLLDNAVAFKMPTFDGRSKDFIRYAVLRFELKGQLHELTVYRSVALMTNPVYKDYLFLPFTDQTNGGQTYDGGRYLDLSMKNMSGNVVVLDFNKAYNPYCAYSDGYQCPVPPAENDLKLPLEAGEQRFAGDKKHR